MADQKRRAFLSGLLAASMWPKPTWAEAGSPVLLSAAKASGGRYVLCGINNTFDIIFQIPLPARGHAAAVHPMRPEAVVFARRPGTFACIIDCLSGRTIAALAAPKGRHFYGHGTYSQDGAVLFTTENNYGAGRGCIGLWDATNGYARIEEWNSGGIGPHDIKRIHGSDILVVANGGIDTHPNTGRAKLNIATMRSNLSYIRDGQIIETAKLSDDHRKNSIRHLAVGSDGHVAFGMQWQGEAAPRGLVGSHRMSQHPTVMAAPADEIHALNGYVGSVAISHDGALIFATSPRGNCVQTFDADGLQWNATRSLLDVCGIANFEKTLCVSSGSGRLEPLHKVKRVGLQAHHLAWDNHLVSV